MNFKTKGEKRHAGEGGRFPRFRLARRQGGDAAAEVYPASGVPPATLSFWRDELTSRRAEKLERRAKGRLGTYRAPGTLIL